MEINSFFEETVDDVSREYKILVYPNITYQSDLEKDSFVVVIGNIIKELNKIRNDLFWTLILPKHIPSLDFDNTEQIYYGYPSYPNSMRCHFDFNKMMKLIDWKHNEWDIVYSHLPEHTLQLKNLFYNTTNCKPIFVGYTHWSEFPEITNYEQTLLDINFLGLAEMIECGINTVGQKNLILKNAKKRFNDDFVAKLDSIIKPHYLGWGIPEYDKADKFKEKVIVFNHRPHEYKSYPWFIKMMDKLREQRGDFKVWVPLAEKPERDFFFVGKNKTRREYLTTLSRCRFGVCGKQKYAGWAVSATDGMSVGIPYLYSDDDYYHELADHAGLYFDTAEDFLKKCNQYLDDNKLYNKHSNSSLKRFSENTWKHNIYRFDDMFNKATKSLRCMSETDSYKKIVKYIHDNKSVSKNDIMEYLGWGVRISFTDYRNRLRNETGIKLTKSRYTSTL